MADDPLEVEHDAGDDRFGVVQRDADAAHDTLTRRGGGDIGTHALEIDDEPCRRTIRFRDRAVGKAAVAAQRHRDAVGVVPDGDTGEPGRGGRVGLRRVAGRGFIRSHGGLGCGRLGPQHEM